MSLVIYYQTVGFEMNFDRHIFAFSRKNIDINALFNNKYFSGCEILSE